jgi:tRNA dimethylallyltransferase
MTHKTETDRPRLVILLGPTGAGKSRLAMEIAEAVGGEIISADSMQVYKHMDIGTDKPTPEEQEKVRHHLIDLVFPDQPFHAGLYRSLGQKTVDQLHGDGKPTCVVGGTGLYIKTLTRGLFPSPPIDPGVRERLKREGEEKGSDVLFQRLKEVDPETASKLHPHDLFRIGRALEVFESAGVPVSLLRGEHHFGDSPYRLLKIGLKMDREKLYRRIEERVDRMIERGFLKEVRGLLERGYGPQLKPMQGLGYKQLISFIRKEIGWDEAIRQIKRDTRHYAKRQWTWFQADPEVCWRDQSVDRERTFNEVISFLQGGG